MSEDNGPDGLGGDSLSPHPLVLGVAGKMFGDLDVRQAHKLANANRYSGGSVEVPREPDPSAADFVQRFTHDRERRELVMLAGYLGARATDPNDPIGTPWQILYKNETLEEYCLVRSTDIQFHDRMDDASAAFGMRDLLWVLAEASVIGGARTESVTTRVTTGTLTRARDFRASLSGGTLTGGSDLGPLCTALTPCCCKRMSP